jgi:hypothetical protein
MSENHEQENLTQEIQENEMPNDEHHNPDNQVKDDDSSKKITSGHEIISEEDNKKYFLEFVKKNSLIKIILSERDIFPYKTYELLTSLEELQPKNNYLLNFNSPEELVSELNNPNTTINFTLRKKQANIIELFFIFPIEGEEEDNTLEIELTADQINDREMFRQLFEKYKSIQQEQNEDIEQFMNRIAKIEEILTPHEVKQANEDEKEVNKGDEIGEEKEKNNENVGEKKSEEEKKIEEDKISEVKSSNKASKKSIQKGKNEKKGNFGKKEKFEKKEVKGKKNQKIKNSN